MTTSRTLATIARTPPSAGRVDWLFPGRIQLALVVNWQQAPMEAMLHDLKVARELECVKDSTLIAGLRRLSAQCSLTLELCRAEHC